MLQLIFGTSGSGKTYTIRQNIADAARAGKKSLLIVPEQYSFESERALFNILGPKLTGYAQVLSFKRLADTVISLFPDERRQSLDSSGKLIAMSVALLQLSDTLSYYSSKIHNAAFASKLLSASDELKNACVSSDDLRELSCVAENSSMRDKFSELALILDCYDAIVEKSGSDPSDDIARACKILDSHSDFFSDSLIFIDAFNGFTLAEFKLIEHMLINSEKVTVSLECESALEDAGSIFSDVSASASRLISLSRKNSVPVATPLKLNSQYRFKAPELAFLEKNIMRSSSEQFTDDPSGAVSASFCSNIYSEAQFVCENIIRLVRDENFRYRDIAVICRDTAKYSDALFSAFERFGIPFFDDRRIPAASKPLMSLVLCVCEIVCLGFNTESILKLLKTGFFPYSDTEIGSLENYCYVWDIKGSDWLHSFKGNPRGFEEFSDSDKVALERINQIRRSVVLPIEELRSQTIGCDGAKFASELYRYLLRIDAKKSCADMMKHFSDIGETALADEFPAVWELVINLLDQISCALSGEIFPPRRLYEILYTVISKLDIADIPHFSDEVTFGNAERIRTGDIRAVFVIGLNEGVFPPKHSDSGVFTGEDREFLINRGFNVVQSSRNKSSIERLYLYQSLTCASERLFLSCSRSEPSGAALQPSFIISSISKMFPNLTVAEFIPDIKNSICNDKTAFYLYSSLRNQNSELVASLRQLLLSTPYADKVRAFDKSCSADSFSVGDKSLAKALVGSKLRFSPSSLERFHKCKFQYFCRDALRIKPPRKAAMSPIETGSLIHFVLEKMLIKYGADGLAHLDEKISVDEISALLKEYLEVKLGGDFRKSTRFDYTYNRLAGTIHSLLVRLGAEFAQSKFIPTDFEMHIAEDSDTVKPIKLYAKDGSAVLVEGYVDRIDTMQLDGKTYVRVVDYKSGNKKFKLSDIYYGLNLQMLLYMFSVCQNGEGIYKNSIPAGVLYMPSGAAVIAAPRSISKEDTEKLRFKFYRMNGITISDKEVLEGMEKDLAGKFIPAAKLKNGNLDSRSSVADITQFAVIKKYIEKLLVDMANSLIDGNFRAIPANADNHSPCDFCDYKSLCRRTAASPANQVRSFSNEQFFKTVSAELEQNI